MPKTVHHPVFGEVESIWTLLSPWAMGIDQWFDCNKTLELSLSDFRWRFDLGGSITYPAACILPRGYSVTT